MCRDFVEVKVCDGSVCTGQAPADRRLALSLRWLLWDVGGNSNWMLQWRAALSSSCFPVGFRQGGKGSWLLPVRGRRREMAMGRLALAWAQGGEGKRAHGKANDWQNEGMGQLQGERRVLKRWWGMLTREEGGCSEGKGNQAEICVWKRQLWSRKQMDRKVQKQGLELIRHRSRDWITCISLQRLRS